MMTQLLQKHLQWQEDRRTIEARQREETQDGLGQRGHQDGV